MLSRILLVLACSFTAAAGAPGADLAEGDWLVADPDANAVYRIDPGTLDTVVLSADQSFRYPSGVAADPQWNVYVTDPDADAVFRVDSESGMQTLGGNHVLGQMCPTRRPGSGSPAMSAHPSG